MARKPRQLSLRAYAPVAGIALAVLLVVGALAWLVIDGIGEPVAPTKKTVQQITVIKPPPPPETPPPPPPPEEKVEIDEPEPEPEVAEAEQPPIGDQLGLDADGSAGGDAFGLLARKGGRDLLAGGDDRFGWYSNVLKGDLIGRLSEIRDIRRDRYSVSVRLWLAPDGRVERYALQGSTGKPDLDRDLRTALAALDRVSERPPAGLPQPIRLRIVSRI